MKNKVLCSLTALVIFIIVLSVASCSDYLNVQDDFSASDSKAFVLTQNPAQGNAELQCLQPERSRWIR